MSSWTLELQNYTTVVCGSSPVDVNKRPDSVFPRFGDSVVDCVEITSTPTELGLCLNDVGEGLSNVLHWRGCKTHS